MYLLLRAKLATDRPNTMGDGGDDDDAGDDVVEWWTINCCIFNNQRKPINTNTCVYFEFDSMNIFYTFLKILFFLINFDSLNHKLVRPTDIDKKKKLDFFGTHSFINWSEAKSVMWWEDDDVDVLNDILFFSFFF